MVKSEILGAHERRLAVQMQLAQGPCTRSKLLRLPCYRDPDKPASELLALLESDIRMLRLSGVPIDYTRRDGSEVYTLNDAHKIALNFDQPLDLTMLRSILAAKGRSISEEYAQVAVNKLLAQAQLGQGSNYRAVVPTGDHIFVVARAIESALLLRIHYHSVHSNADSMRVVQPIAVEVHHGSFYFLGFQLELDGETCECPELRRYKAERLLSEPVALNSREAAAFETMLAALEEQRSAALDQAQVDAQQYFGIVQPVLSVRTGTSGPLVELANNPDEVARALAAEAPWIRVELPPISSSTVLDYLLFYGSDVQLLEPQWLRQILGSRLRRLAAIGRSSEVKLAGEEHSRD